MNSHVSEPPSARSRNPTVPNTTLSIHPETYADIYPEIVNFSIHISEKIIYDDEPIEGYVQLTLNDLENHLEDVIIALKCTLHYSAPEDLPPSSASTPASTENVLYEAIQRGAVPFVDGMPSGNYEYPFSFSFDAASPCASLPESMRMNSCSVIDPRELLSIRYEIRAYAMYRENNPQNRLHLRCVCPFLRRVTMAPRVNSPLSVYSGSKKETFGRGLLKMTAFLDQHVYEKDAPIFVDIAIDNHTSKKVYALRISVKQVVEFATLHPLADAISPLRKEHHFKHHLAVVEEFTNFPIKKGESRSLRISIRPEDFSSIGIAKSLEFSSPPSSALKAGDLCPTILPSTLSPLSVSYYMNIHCCVHLASDLILTLPFLVSDRPSVPNSLRDRPPAYYSTQYHWTEKTARKSASLFASPTLNPSRDANPTAG
eukprot:Sdes_comp19311_c0_seq1m10431